jgi:hypothetical protein
MSQPPKTPALARCGSDSCGHDFPGALRQLPQAQLRHLGLQGALHPRHPHWARPGDLLALQPGILPRACQGRGVAHGPPAAAAVG